MRILLIARFLIDNSSLLSEVFQWYFKLTKLNDASGFLCLTCLETALGSHVHMDVFSFIQYITDINICLGWSDYKWTLLNRDVIQSIKPHSGEEKKKCMGMHCIWSVNAIACWCVPGNIPGPPTHLPIIHLDGKGFNLLLSYIQITKKNHPMKQTNVFMWIHVPW